MKFDCNFFHILSFNFQLRVDILKTEQDLKLFNQKTDAEVAEAELKIYTGIKTAEAVGEGEKKRQ